METVVCGKCGQRFAICHDHGLEDVKLAKKQAAWVTDLLVWDHIQERHHPRNHAAAEAAMKVRTA